MMALASSEKYQVDEISPANSSLEPFPIGEFGMPCNWDGENHTKHNPHQPFTLVKLSEKCWEYTSIETEFKRAGATVLRVERIENKELWEKFYGESKRMLRSRTAVNEVYLFHGSKGSKEDICHEGLDQRLARIGHFGRGIYFSNDVRKCFSYTKKDESIDNSVPAVEKECTIYKCRVLLGIVKVYEKGQNAKQLKREPKLDEPGPGGLKYYDSVKGQISEFEEFIVYKSERVLPEYIITCLPPNTPATDSGNSQGAAAAAAPVTDVQSLPFLPTTNGHSDPAPGSPTNSVHSVDLDDEESWEVKFSQMNPGQSEPRAKTSNGLVARGIVERSQSVEDKERSKSVEDVDFKEETCDSAEEDVFESPTEEMCESAGEDDVKSDDDIYSSATSSLNSNQVTGAATASSVSKQDCATASDSDSLSPMFKSEDEFQRHLLEVRRRVRERRRAEEAEQARLGIKVPPIPVTYRPPPAVPLDDEHQRKLLEVRKRVREKRMKEGRLSIDEANQEAPSSSSSSVDQDVILLPDEPEDNVQEVMSQLLAQFLEFTGCDDSEVATRYIRHAQMDVNDAIMMYINATSV